MRFFNKLLLQALSAFLATITIMLLIAYLTDGLFYNHHVIQCATVMVYSNGNRN